MLCCKVNAQTNLVPNGSFEDTIRCPYNGTTVNYSCQKWYTSSMFGTADHFCSCSNKDSITLLGATVGVPYNFIGNQFAKEGSCYGGLCTNIFGSNFKEYISVKLVSPLKKGTTYKLSMYISLGDSCVYATKSISCLFSKLPFVQTGYGTPNTTPQIEFQSSTYFSDKINWVHLLDSNFNATGNEEYLTIGNFDTTSSNTTFLSFPHSFIPGVGNEYNSAYYYIDNIELFENDYPLIIPNIFTPNNDGVNDHWTIKNINDGNSVCYIYNRWGYEVLKLLPINSEFNWDGNEMFDGVYYYYIIINKKSYKGFIQLIR